MSQYLDPDEIRSLFSQAMSEMYRAEVPQYGALCNLVADVNDQILRNAPHLAKKLQAEGQLERLGVERHGAVRVGTHKELFNLRRLFAVMGMKPVGYYDLSVAGVPVHSTAFRPIDQKSLERNPFRVFTSLLRLELISDVNLREQAKQILNRRKIFTPECLSAIDLAERQGGLTAEEAKTFVNEALETFRWHSEATVDLTSYQQLRGTHALVADIVCFKGPHINHLTPRTLDIDCAQVGMPTVGIEAKKTIEGPPKRSIPILLRQTSFLALAEPIHFIGGDATGGTHTARFGEIEQRGCALTRQGRELYDHLLSEALAHSAEGIPIEEAMTESFSKFPDDEEELYRRELAFFNYQADERRLGECSPPTRATIQELIAGGWIKVSPITYEDFLPVSAAGIFRSNLGDEVRGGYTDSGNKTEFEEALGASVLDEFALYQSLSDVSLKKAMDIVLPSEIWTAIL